MRRHVAQRLGAAAPSSLRRYEALLAASRSPKGLERRIEQDRGRELAALLHPNRTRWLKLVTVATGGLYQYRVRPSHDRLALLDRERRLAHAARVLEAALGASPSVDAGTDFDRIRRAARELAAGPSVKSSTRQRTESLLARLSEQAANEEVWREILTLWNASAEATRERTPAAGGGTD